MKLVPRLVLLLLFLASYQRCSPEETGEALRLARNLDTDAPQTSLLNMLKEFFFTYNLGAMFGRIFVWMFNLFSGSSYVILTELSALKEYDYVIVGAGTSGSVIANRLSEDPHLEILVLEAGGEESKFSNVPLLAPLSHQSDLVLNVENEPQGKAARGMKSSRIHSKVGHCIGGSSSQNNMIYDRGDPLDYDIWAQKYGATGWSYADVFPYFFRSEGVQFEQKTVFDEGYHSKFGPLTVEGLTDSSLVGSVIFQGIQGLGLPVGDYNGKRHDTFNYASVNIRDGERCSTGKAFLGPASLRDTIDIVPKATVTKVLLNELNDTAIGVEYKKDGLFYTVLARKEVILAAGAYKTPQILMLSGIGPQKHLRKHDIPLRVHLSGVGRNLAHHVETALFYIIKNKSVSPDQSKEIVNEALNYELNRTGIFTSPGYSILGHQRSRFASDERPDLGLLVVDGMIGTPKSHPFYALLHDIGQEVIDKYLIPQTDKNGFQIQAFNYRTESRGYVKLRSSDPLDPPVVNGKVFANGTDLDKLVEACLLADSIVKSPIVQGILEPEPFPNTLPGCTVFEVGSEEFFRCLSQTITFNSFQPCCTCKIGPKDDDTAVVDPELRVYGVKNLRIADASVMPEITTGDITAPTIMIGEMASDLIRGFKIAPTLPPINTDLVLSWQIVELLNTNATLNDTSSDAEERPDGIINNEDEQDLHAWEIEGSRDQDEKIALNSLVLRKYTDLLAENVEFDEFDELDLMYPDY